MGPLTMLSLRFVDCHDAHEHVQHSDGGGLRCADHRRRAFPLPSRPGVSDSHGEHYPCGPSASRVRRSAPTSPPVHRDRPVRQRHFDGEAPAVLTTPSRPTALNTGSRTDPSIGMRLARVSMTAITAVNAHGESLPYEQRRSTTGTGRRDEVYGDALVNCVPFLRCDFGS